MADLGNQKIKDTYQLVLQTDTSGNLQNLSGGTPSPFIVNGNLRYADGTQSSGYVLISDGSGNASWGPVAFSGDVYVTGGTIEETTIQLNSTSGDTISIPGLCWSSSTSGHISNSGLTGNVGVGTSTPNVDLTISGSLSATGVSNLGSVGISGQYIRYQNSNRIWLAAYPWTDPSKLTDDWQMVDDDHLYFGTGEDLDIYHSGSHSYIDNDNGSLYVTSSVLYLGDTTSETTVQDNLTVNDNLKVSSTALYVDSTNGKVGVGTTNQDAILTVSGTSGTDWTAWEDGSMTSISFVNGVPFLRYEDSGITVPDPLQDSGTPVRVKVLGVYYYGTTTGDNFVNGRGYFGLTWSQSDITITSNLGEVISYGGVDAEEKIFKVYNGSNPAFQISGTTVMSGSTDLLDMFASSGITNQDVYWSANTDGSITNSGNTDITTTGDITVGNVYSRDTYRLLDSGGTSRHFIAGPDSTVVSNNSVSIGNANFSDGISIINNISATGNLNISGSTSYIGAVSGTGSVTAVGGFVGDVTGRADTAIVLAVARAIGGVFFNGSANIDLPGVNTAGNQDTSGNADTSTKIASITNSNIVQLSSTTTQTGTKTFSGVVDITNSQDATDASGDTGALRTEGGASILKTLYVGNGIVGNLLGDVTGNADTVTNGVYTSNNLSVMAATTSTQLRGVLSDETGTGSAVFATSPTLVTPALGTPASGVLTNCTGYPEAALPPSINAIKIADGTVTSTEFQYINTLSANAQTQINTVHSTRSHFLTTTCILKIFASNTWCGFNTSTGGQNTNGYWNLDTGETDIADAYTYYDTYKNSFFTTPYAGKIKRLLINGTSQTGAAVADTININLAKATTTDGNDRPNWSEVTATTKTLPGTAGTTAHKSKHYVWDIPIDMSVSQYDSFLLLFKNPNNQLTWLPISILLEFEYTIT